MDSLIRLLFVLAARLSAPLLIPIDYGLRRLWRSLRGNGWLAIDGKIHTVRTEQKEAFWIAEFSYYYSVEGEFYSGYDQKQFARERKMDEYVALYQPGTTIIVRVKPRNHQVSFIEDLYSDQPIYARLKAG